MLYVYIYLSPRGRARQFESCTTQISHARIFSRRVTRASRKVNVNVNGGTAEISRFIATVILFRGQLLPRG